MSVSSRWHVAFAAAALNAIQAGSFFFTPTTLMPLIVSDFAIPLSLSTVPIAVGKVAYVLLLIPGGIVVDRYGPRLCVLIGIFGLALVLTLYALFICTLSWQLLAHVAMAVFASVSGVPVYSIFIAQWFKDGIGLAMGLVLAGFSAAGTAAPLMLAPIAAAMGWRLAMAAVCAVLWFIGLPVTFFFLHEHHQPSHALDVESDPQRAAFRHDAAPPPQPLIPERPLVSHKSFTFVGFALSYILLQYCFGCFGENIMFYLTIDGSLSLAFASLFFSVLNFASFSAKLVGGHLGDHFDRFHVAAVASALAAIGITFLFNFGAGLDDYYLPHLAESMFPVLIFAVLFGFGYGATFNSLYALTPIVFGKQNLGRTQSTFFGLGLVGNAVGSVLTGVLRSRYGTYQLPFFITALVCAFNFFVFNLTRLSLGGSVSAMKVLAEERAGVLCDGEDEGSGSLSAYQTPLLASSASLPGMSPMLASATAPKDSPLPAADRYDEQIRALSTYDSIEMLPEAHGAIRRSGSRYSGTGMVPENGYPIVRDWSDMSLRSHLQSAMASSPVANVSIPPGARIRKSSTFEAMIDSGILSASMEAVGYLGTNEATLGISSASASHRTPGPSPLLRSTPVRSPTHTHTQFPSPPSSNTTISVGNAALPSLPPLSAKTHANQPESSHGHQ